MIDFNEVRPHDALGGKTPAEVYRDSERHSLTPLVPSYPPEWRTRRVSRVGSICVNNDVVFVSTALAGEIIGLHQESALQWRAHFFGVDLGTIEIVPLNDAFTSDPVTPPVSTVNPKRQPATAQDRQCCPYDEEPSERTNRQRLNLNLPLSKVSAMS